MNELQLYALCEVERVLVEVWTETRLLWPSLASILFFSSRGGSEHAQGMEEEIKGSNVRRTLYMAEENLSVWTGLK